MWRSPWLKSTLIAISSCLSVLVLSGMIVCAQVASDSNLPPAKIHSLPEFLASWHEPNQNSNYFKQIESTPLGYLIWTQFPVKIFVEHPLHISLEETAEDRRFQNWITTVEQAIIDWQVYFPLQAVSERKAADIMVRRTSPPREAKPNPKTGLFDLPRAVTAETKYKFYLQQNPTKIAHKMTIEISPDYTGISLLATTRHEIGHALGIWGHSLEKSDALYNSQVSNPPGISVRDINTLKKIYQQPTKLGWKITN